MISRAELFFWLSFCTLANIDSYFGLSHRVISSFFAISTGDWRDIDLYLIAGLLSIVLRWWRTRRMGVITATGIKLGGLAEEIPFAEIQKIRCKPQHMNILWADTTEVFVLAGKESVLYFTDHEAAKLAKTRLNQWTLDAGGTKKGWAIFLPGEPEAGLKVSYGPVGKYASDMQGIFPMSVLLPVIFIAEGFHLVSGFFIVGAIILAFAVGCIAEYYRRITASVDAEGVTLNDETGREHVVAFADVAKVERGFFRTRVTTKSGEVQHFPRGCYLLPEIIEEFAGLAKR
ncbi:MAG: hypothetical protein P4N59_18240 [Negativicutes bacterium]|nr:hypothetical protein [Negativicutes bacterium]